MRTLETTVGEAATPAYCCHADAEAAAAKRRARQSTSHQVAVGVEERPTYGPGRPSPQPPRGVKARRSGLQVTRHARAEGIARKTQETGCVVLLTKVPTAGEMAPRAGDVRRADKEQQGIAQNVGFLKAPRMVNRLFRQKPERLEALGGVVVLALRIWRWMERSLRLHVEMTGNALPGWDKQETRRPPAFMMVTKFAAVMVLKVGPQR